MPSEDQCMKMTRRSSSKKMAVGAGALALGGSKLIAPARAEVVLDGWSQKVLWAAARDLPQIPDQLMLYPPESIDWRLFANANFAIRAVERYWGLDQWLQQDYG